MLPLLAPPTTWRSFFFHRLRLQLSDYFAGPCLCPSSASSISRCVNVTADEVEGQWNLLLIANGTDFTFTGGNFIWRHWLWSETMRRPIWKLGWVALPLCIFPSYYAQLLLIDFQARAYYYAIKQLRPSTRHFLLCQPSMWTLTRFKRQPWSFPFFLSSVSTAWVNRLEKAPRSSAKDKRNVIDM